MSKTIFVIGANSAIAREAIKLLAVDNTIITGGRRHCDVYCDVTQSVALPIGTDVVVNFAAAFGGTDDEAITNAVQTNAVGMLRICIASKKAGVSHVVNISSLSALHNKKSPYYSIYALTKRNGDELAELYCSSNKIPLTILRPSQVYGNDIGFAAHQPFFYQVVDKAERGEDIAVYGKNDALRNYIHVSDLSETIHQVIAQSIEGTYACLYPTNIRFSAIARTAQKVFNKGGEVIFLEGKPDTPDNVFDLDTSVYEKTGHPPQVTLEEGIQGIKAYREGIQR